MKERVTVTLPPDVLREVDARSNNRSQFLLSALRLYLEKLRQDELAKSLASPHPESAELADQDLRAWVEAGSDDAELLDGRGGRRVSWRPGKGWR